jgi:hypothetical protein
MRSLRPQTTAAQVTTASVMRPAAATAATIQKKQIFPKERVAVPILHLLLRLDRRQLRWRASLNPFGVRFQLLRAKSRW